MGGMWDCGIKVGWMWDQCGVDVGSMWDGCGMDMELRSMWDRLSIVAVHHSPGHQYRHNSPHIAISGVFARAAPILLILALPITFAQPSVSCVHQQPIFRTYSAVKKHILLHPALFSLYSL